MEMKFAPIEKKEKNKQQKETDNEYLVCCGQKMILADDHGTASCGKCGRVVDI